MDISSTIETMTAERDKLDRAIAALSALEATPDQSPAPTRRKPIPRAVRRSSGSVNGISRALPIQQRVLELVTPEGVPAVAIRSGVKASDGQVLSTLKDLEAEGLVKRTGNRRSTRWHLVS